MQRKTLRLASNVLVFTFLLSTLFSPVSSAYGDNNVGELGNALASSVNQSVYSGVYEGEPSLSPSPTNSPTPVDSLEEGLAAYYEFDGNSNDSSGNGNNAIVWGSDWVDSIKGRAVKLGSNIFDRIFIPHTVINGATDFAFSTILQIDTVNTQQIANGVFNALVSCDNVLKIYYVGPKRNDGSAGPNQWVVLINGTGYNFQGLDSSLGDGKYHHIVVLRQGSLLKLFIDGIQIGNSVQAVDTALSVAKNRFIIGQGESNISAQSLGGRLDELRVYRRALDNDEILKLYNNYFPTATIIQTTTATPTATPTPASVSGKIIVNHDEWTISDSGYSSGNANEFVTNILKLFKRDGAGNYLVYTSNFAYGSSFLNQVKSLGNTIEKRTDITLDLSTMKNYDGLFLTAPQIPDNDLLTQYVRDGGNVYVCGGTSSENEYTGWNKFLNNFGLNIQGYYNWISGSLACEQIHSVLIGVQKLYYQNGQTVEKLTGVYEKSAAYIITKYNDKGLIGVYDEGYSLDIEKPTTPKNITIANQTASSITLAWEASQDSGAGVYGYNVYRNDIRIKTVIGTSFTDTGLEPGTSYKYTVSALDKAGNESSQSSEVTGTTSDDTEAPTVPTNVVVAYKTGSSVTLSWNPSTDNCKVEGYEVSRDGVVIGTTDKTSYKDTGLTAGTAYKYTVKAYDKVNKSNSSNEITTIPLKPHILKVEPLTGVTVGGNIVQTFRVWFANSNNTTGMTAKLTHSTDGTTWVEDKPSYGPYVWDSTNAYFNWNVNLGSFTSGSYKMIYTITDEDLNTDSLEVEYQIDRTIPGIPTNLFAASDMGKINLNWSVVGDNDIKGYKIYRSSSENGTYGYLTMVNGVSNNYYNDLHVGFNTTYYYKVTAVDKFDQESGYSNTASSKPLSDTVPPVVLGIEPGNANVFGPSAYITVRADDNIGVESIKLQYSMDKANWSDIERKQSSGTTSFNWNTSPTNGNVSVRAIVYDKAGLVSDGTPIRNYTVDTKGPGKVLGLSYVPHTTYVVLKWNDVSDKDFSYFAVEKKKADGSFERIGTTGTTLGMNVTGLSPKTSYTYRVAAYDKFGNRGEVSDEILVTTLDDSVAPRINGIGPSPDSFGKTIPLWVSAGDNSNVTSVKIQVSNDLTSWTDLATVNNTGYGQSFTAYYNYDVSKLEEGKIAIRAIAYDGDLQSASEGNYVEYMIDHTGPVAPSNFELTPDTGCITLKWEKSADLDSKYYRVYRSLSDDGEFSILADNVTYLGYRDRNVEFNKDYFYKVSAVDTAGNEGQVTSILSNKCLSDDEKPVIYSISPSNGSVLPANPKIAVLAADNYKLAKIVAEYKAFGAGDTWIKVFEGSLTQYSEVSTFAFDTTGLSEGSYEIRVTVWDSFGKESDTKSNTYTLNLLPPQKPEVTAKEGGWKAELSWSANSEPDFAGYRIYRSTTSGSNYQLINQTTGLNYVDNGLTPGVAYYYVVEALDTYRNSNKSIEAVVVPTDEDTTNPTANAGNDQTTATGIAVWFDGTLSKDNNRIAEYSWDFGDGTTSSQAQPMHVYGAVGTYTVTLTVKDPAGNENTDTAVVTVKAPLQIGTLEIKVVDDSSGLPLSGSSIVVEYSDGTIYNTTTNGSGYVNVVVPEGSYRVYAYKSDYKPTYTNTGVTVNTKTPITLKLASGQIVVGELNVKRLTLDEIKDAGIDVTAPENQWVYKFEVHLAFHNKPLPTQEFIVNGNGSVINYAPLYISGSGSGGSAGGGYIAYPVAIPVPNHPEVRPTIAYLVIPGEARFLKEFFEVSLALENTADPVFIIEQSKAVLKLPEGLALATTREAQSLEVNLGDFAGGEKKEVKWIIRGDKKGEYTLEADFTGILQPFGEPVKAIFKNRDSFRVWGDDALKLNIYAQDNAEIGHPYNVRFELENVSDIPVYYPAIELLESGKQNYFYAPNQELVKSVETLPAGQKLVKEYTLVPAIKGKLDLSKSYVLKTGGNCEIPSTIHEVSVPQNSKDVAPKLTETQNGNFVTLNWGAVQGATGYKIYSIRKDLLMSDDPELIVTVNETTTTYNVTETESKDYIVTTLLPEGEVYRHAINWPYGVNPAPAVVTVNPDTVIVGNSTELLITSNKGGFPVVGGKAKIGTVEATLDANGQARITVNPTTEGILEVQIYDKQGNFLVSKKVTVIETTVGNDIIVDNNDAGFETDSSWVKSIYVYGYYGNNYVHDGSGNADSTKWAKWTPEIKKSGYYKVYMRWTAAYNRGENVPVEIKSVEGLDITKTINQKENGGKWVNLGTYILASGKGNYVKILASSEGYTIADAVKFEYVGDVECIVDNSGDGFTTDSPWVKSTCVYGYYGDNYVHDGSGSIDSTKWAKWTPDIKLSGSYNIYMRWPAAYNRGENVPVEINSAIGLDRAKIINQKENGGEWVKLGTYILASGKDNYVKILASCEGFTIADAVKFEYVDDAVYVIDNSDAEFTTDTSWVTSTNVKGYYGDNYVHDGSGTADVKKWAKWTPDIKKAGCYKVYMKWSAAYNRPENAPIEIKSADGLDSTKTINQKVNGGKWVNIGEFNFDIGTNNYIKVLGSCLGYTIADSVMLEYVGEKK